MGRFAEAGHARSGVRRTAEWLVRMRIVTAPQPNEGRQVRDPREAGDKPRGAGVATPKFDASKFWGSKIWSHKLFGLQKFGALNFWGSKILGLQNVGAPATDTAGATRAWACILVLPV
mgnify:CR=1 FL=1